MPKYRRSGFLNFRSRRYRREITNFSLPKVNFSFWSELSPEVKKGLSIIFLFVLAILSILGLFDLSGQFGKFIAYILSIILGNAKWLVPIILGGWVFFLLNEDKYPIKTINFIGAILFLIGLAGLMHLRFDSWEALKQAKLGSGGGYLGAFVVLPLLRFMNFWGALVICVAVLLVGILLALETSIYGLMWPLKLIKFLWSKVYDFYNFIKIKNQEKKLREIPEELDDNYEEETNEEDSEINEEALEENNNEEDDLPQFTRTQVNLGFRDQEPEKEIIKPKKFGKKIDLPLSLVNAKSGKPTSGDIKNNQEIIRKTFANFGIQVEMGDVNVGPTITQYTLRPADGVKLSRLVNLSPDLALALAAHPIRIEAPIPGKSLVGVEIPNQMSAKVSMGEMLLSKEFKTRDNNLSIALGKDVSGKACFAQLDKMPHLLIAGATGSGKSVCVNSIIVSLLYQNSPDELKFILVDPKRVELPHYNNIPYLLTPVITDVKKTVGALKWSITEMERRFELLSKLGHRNIASYNKTHPNDKMPYIVIVIDELAELMSANPNDMEAGIVRLAQMARAVGIHLVLATQRPSTEVITGLIKANIPARIAFAVASSIDSRTILDGTGAEKLVGRGDMLFLSPDISKPKRIQGVFLSDQEINNVINYIKNQGGADYIEELSGMSTSINGFGGGVFSEDDGDPLLNEAIEVIRQSGKASASLLQRRLKLGYARAARILDLLEEKGIIGPADGAKPREVFLDKLGGVGVVEFAAREHNLTGELRPLEEEIKEEEPSFTAFTRNELTDVDNTEINELDNKNDKDLETEENSFSDSITNNFDQLSLKETSNSNLTDLTNLEKDKLISEVDDIKEVEEEALEEIAETLDLIEEIKEEVAEKTDNNQEQEIETPQKSQIKQKKESSKNLPKKKNYFDDEEWS